MSRAIYEEICRDFREVYFYSIRAKCITGFTPQRQPIGTEGDWKIPNIYTVFGSGRDKTLTAAFLSFDGNVYIGYARGIQASNIADKISRKYGDNAFSGTKALPWLFK